MTKGKTFKCAISKFKCGHIYFVNLMEFLCQRDPCLNLLLVLSLDNVSNIPIVRDLPVSSRLPNVGA